MIKFVASNDRSSERAVATLLVAAACVLQLATMGRAVVGLVIALIVSFVLWLGRSDWGPPRAVVPAYVAAVVVQCAHLVEEYRTGFHVRFPPLFGAEAWSARQFLAFNLLWLVVFVAAAVGVAHGKRLAYLAALFLALGGGVANGLAHLALTARAGEYFPGAYTGALALIAGAVLLQRLTAGR